jgi:hypothetical protein
MKPSNFLHMLEMSWREIDGGSERINIEEYFV